MLDPLAEEAGAHGGIGFIQDPQEGAALLLGEHGFRQLQVPAGGGVHVQVLGGLVDIEVFEEGAVLHLGVADVFQGGAHGNQGHAGLSGHGVRAELLLGPGGGVIRIEEIRGGVGEAGVQAVLHVVGHGGEGLRGEVHEDLPGGVGGELGDDPLPAPGIPEGGGCDKGGGDIAEADPGRASVAVHGAEIVIGLFVEQVGFDEGAGGDDADDLPLHQILGQLRVLHLLADRHLIALFDEAADIGFGGMVGDAAHGSPLLLSAVPPGEGEIQLLGYQLGVLEKHLVKIPQTVEQDEVGVLIFYVEILLHHGGHGQTSER